MIRSRGSVPIAENISAYFATRSVRFLLVPPSIFLYLQKYGCLSSRSIFAALRFVVGLRGRVAVYNHIRAKHVIHVSETEAASDFASLMARRRRGSDRARRAARSGSSSCRASCAVALGISSSRT